MIEYKLFSTEVKEMLVDSFCQTGLSIDELFLEKSGIVVCIKEPLDATLSCTIKAVVQLSPCTSDVACQMQVGITVGNLHKFVTLNHYRVFETKSLLVIYSR